LKLAIYIKNNFEIPESIFKAVKNIVNDVKENGAEAAIKYTNFFDKVSFKALSDAKTYN